MAYGISKDVSDCTFLVIRRGNGIDGCEIVDLLLANVLDETILVESKRRVERTRHSSISNLVSKGELLEKQRRAVSLASIRSLPRCHEIRINTRTNAN